MATFKFQYLRVQRKSDRLTVKRIDVSHLNKKGRETEWDKLDKEFPPEHYITCYETSKLELPVFSNPN